MKIFYSTMAYKLAENFKKVTFEAKIDFLTLALGHFSQ
jgi:hypothetical protein